MVGSQNEFANSPRPLQEQLEKLAEDVRAKEHPETIAAVSRAIEELVASKRSHRALKAGALAPDFSLLSDTGTRVNLADLRRKGPVVVTFYWGSWSRICSLELKALEKVASTLKGYGATVLAVAQHSPSDGRETRRQNRLTYALLSDPNGLVAEMFGLRWPIPDYLREALIAQWVGFSGQNSDQHWSLPIPARYVIGMDGAIAYAEINLDYRMRAEPSDMFATLGRLARF